ncbi:MAG: hypothetical protein R2875_02280 [Desulfobacterales bacterium]
MRCSRFYWFAAVLAKPAGSTHAVSGRKNAGGRTLGSATMPYTGVLIIAFVVVHLLNFHFIDHTEQTVFRPWKPPFHAALCDFTPWL